MNDPRFHASRSADRFRRPGGEDDETLGWQFEFLQLERGPLTIRMRLVGSGEIDFMYTRINRRTDQRGRSPRDRYTFSILADGTPPYLWCGQEVAGDSLMFFPPGSHFGAIGPHRFEVWMVMLSRNALFSLVEAGGGSLGGLMNFTAPCVIRRDLTAVREWRRMIEESIQRSRAGDPSLAPILHAFRQSFPRVAKGDGSDPHRTMAASSRLSRLRALSRALDYARSHAEDAPGISELCEAARMKERTLRNAFVEHVGLPPKTYIQALRLEEVRNALLEQESLRHPIADVANRWGFWHMGQFAADYRNRFGELPSQTLERTYRVAHF